MPTTQVDSGATTGYRSERRGPRVIAIEVKSGLGRRRLLGLAAFEKRFSPIRSLLVGEGGVPLADFLSVPPDHWFDSA